MDLVKDAISRGRLEGGSQKDAIRLGKAQNERKCTLQRCDYIMVGSKWRWSSKKCNLSKKSSK